MRILLLGLLLSAPSMAQDRPHVVFFVGESEYGSRETVPAFATEIGERLGLRTTVLHSDMQSRLLPPLDALDDADLIVLALRFRKASDAQMARLRTWFDAGRPAIALRTTSHAFAKRKNWFPPIFGGHYKAHAPNDQGTRTLVLPGVAGHPILRGVDRIVDMGHGGTYNTQPLAATTTPLMLGRTGDRPCEPVTWVNRYRPRSRLLYTSLGSREHFEKRAFRTMLANGVLWCLERPVPAGGALGGEALPDPTAPPRPPPPPRRQAPENASVLFVDAATSALLHWDPSVPPVAIRVDERAHTSGLDYRDARWPAIDGALVARPGFGDVISRDRIGHHCLHLDFLVPEDPAWVPDDFRGRSGVYLGGRVEIEIADSHGRPLSRASCGAIRGVKAPDADAARPAGVWQSLDVAYRNDPGEPARATVWLNGVRIHDVVTLPARTVHGFLEQGEAESSGSAAAPATNLALARGVLGPLRLQADSSRVRFANVWVTPLADVDHARLIRAFDEDAYDRGEEVYLRRCFECHGEGFKRDNPLARNFMKDLLKQGADPHALWRTLTYGSETMPPQTFLSPQERYDAVHYVREEFFKDENPTQYFAVTDAYLESLPIGIPPRETEKPAGVPTTPLRDYGPALASQLQRGVSSAFTVRAGHDVTVSYDLHRMGIAGAWFDAFLDLSQTQHLLHRGEGQAKAAGRPLHGLETWEWAHGEDERFGDPKGHPPRKPLPSSMTRYLGHYYHQRKVVLSYEIDGRRVYEMPAADRSGDHVVISQTLRVEPGQRDLLLCVGRRPRDRKGTHAILPLDLSVRPGVWEQDGAARGHIALAAGAGGALGVGPYIAIGAAGDLTDLEWEIDGDRLLLRLPSSDQPRVVRVMRRSGNGTVDLERFSNAVDLAQRQPVADPKDLTHGGPPRWGEPLVTTGDVAAGSANGYALDRIRLPDPNPFNAWVRPSSLDFLGDGTCVVTTYGGDVWLVSGLDETLEQVRWRRFATGLFEPLGVKVVDGTILVTCRDRITRLHDLNDDGEADFYESFLADSDVSRGYHAFNLDLQTDSKGFLYYGKPGHNTDYPIPGAVIRVAPDASSSERICTGFRVPNGICIGPDDAMYVSDNQGNWMPAGKISKVRPGGFYGYARRLEVIPKTFDQPMIWFPQEFDNSCGNQTFPLDPRFGPLAGKMIHTSYGRGWLYWILEHTIAGVSQAAACRFPFQCDSGVMRVKQSPQDGAVYTVGLKGWDTFASKDGCFHRLRATGAPSCHLVGWRVEPDAIRLEYSQPLDAGTATDPGRWRIAQWNYRWTSVYGSPRYSVKDPEKKGQDEVPVARAELSEDGRSVRLIIEGLRPVHQMWIRPDVRRKDGEPLKDEIYLTINRLF